jgi:hypothetical protein
MTVHLSATLVAILSRSVNPSNIGPKLVWQCKNNILSTCCNLLSIVAVLLEEITSVNDKATFAVGIIHPNDARETMTFIAERGI